MKIAVCDDDRKVCVQIEEIILEYARGASIGAEVELFFSGEQLLKALDGGGFDLIYLDIEMAGVSGIDVGSQIRKVRRDYSTEIVFVSGKEGYDRKLFALQPLNFIAKPVSAGAVIENLEIAREKMAGKNRFFSYKVSTESHRVPLDSIIYFESQGREIRLVTTKGERHYYGRLEDAESELAGSQFIRIHRSYLVNYNHIEILRYREVVMSDGATLPVSRSRQQGLRDLHISKN